MEVARQASNHFDAISLRLLTYTLLLLMVDSILSSPSHYHCQSPTAIGHHQDMYLVIVSAIQMLYEITYSMPSGDLALPKILYSPQLRQDMDS
jgi:hypothetical protein